MALIFVDSFDHYATADLSSKWDNTSDSNLAGTVGATGRNGTQGITFPNLGQRSVNVPSAATYILGFAVQRTAAPSTATHQLCSFKEGTTIHVDLRWNADATLRVTRNGTQLASSGTTVLAQDVWYYIEFKSTIHDTTGSFEVRINGVVENMGTTTSLDTRNAATGVITVVQINNNNANVNPTTIYDDVYIADTSGSFNNDYLGDIRVSALLPDGAGNYTQFTPSTGSNYQNVDEATANGDTDYNADATVNDRDSFSMSNLLTNGTPAGVQVTTQARKADSGTRSIRNFLRISGSNYEGSTKTVSDTYQFHRDMYDTNPATSAAWDQSAVDALEAGYKVQA